jgi:hypothetical protein
MQILALIATETDLVDSSGFDRRNETKCFEREPQISAPWPGEGQPDPVSSRSHSVCDANVIQDHFVSQLVLPVGWEDAFVLPIIC